MSTKTVVELDLVGYGDVCRTLEENIGVKVVAEFNNQIQGFVDTALSSVGAKRKRVVLATTGDGAILAFNQPPDAHCFGTALHLATQAHNATRSTGLAQRWFRIGVATGELNERSRIGGGREIAGMAIVNAVRLETAARPGQVVVDIRTFASLSADVQAIYGPEETVVGKRGEQFAARRCTVVSYGVGGDSPPTVLSVLDLFDHLNPRNQLDRLMLVLEMPPQHRPPNTLSAFDRQNSIVDWAVGNGGCGLMKLRDALKHLIEKQRSGIGRSVL